MPRMTSTSAITGTGFMKCMPITCAGRCVMAAISVIEMLDVLLARIALAGADPGEDALRPGLVPALLLRHAVEVLADRAERAVHELGLGVDQLHVEAVRGEHLRDAVAHRAAADDGDPLDVRAHGHGGLGG